MSGGIFEGSTTGESLAGLPEEQPGMARRTIDRVLREPGGILGLGVLVVLIAMALLAQFIAPYDPLKIGADIPLAGPSAAHWFGTDDLGRDVLSRIMFGAQISLMVSAF